MLQNPQLHYLDNAATTIVAPEVADVINKAMREHWANPSSLYGPGARSEEALNAARAAVARTLGCKSRELYFTSCGSESNNLALLGAVQTRTFGKGIVVSGFFAPGEARILRHDYGCDVLAPDRFAFDRAFPDIPVDKATIEDYMTLILKGESR